MVLREHDVRDIDQFFHLSARVESIDPHHVALFNQFIKRIISEHREKDGVSRLLTEPYSFHNREEFEDLEELLLFDIQEVARATTLEELITIFPDVASRYDSHAAVQSRRLLPSFTKKEPTRRSLTLLPVQDINELLDLWKKAIQSYNGSVQSPFGELLCSQIAAIYERDGINPSGEEVIELADRSGRSLKHLVHHRELRILLFLYLFDLPGCDAMELKAYLAEQDPKSEKFFDAFMAGNRNGISLALS